MLFTRHIIECIQYSSWLAEFQFTVHHGYTEAIRRHMKKIIIVREHNSIVRPHNIIVREHNPYGEATQCYFEGTQCYCEAKKMLLWGNTILLWGQIILLWGTQSYWGQIILLWGNTILLWGNKQKRSTEGCSKFKSPETRQVQERLVSTLEHMQVPKWDRTRCPEE